MSPTEAERPAGCQVICEEIPGRVTLTVPAVGVWQSVKRQWGAFLFQAVVWPLVAAAWVFFYDRLDDLFLLIAAPSAIVFVTLFVFLHLACRRLTAIVENGQLTITKSGLLGSATRIWKREELRGVGVGSELGSDDRLTDFEVVTRFGFRYRYLMGRDIGDLHWLALKIRAALDVPGLARYDVTDRFEQPAGSRVRVRQEPGELVLTIPPIGVLTGMGKEFWRGVYLCEFCALATVGMFHLSAGSPDPVLGSGLFVAIWWISGIVAVVDAIWAGRRRATLSISAGSLTIDESGIFTRSAQWTRDEIVAIRVGTSTVHDSNLPKFELQVVPAVGSRYRTLDSLDKEELLWMATLLRQALDVPAAV
jgi:hypothetical protein